MSAVIETFFEKFGELTDDAQALRKIRGLILDLGLQGKLTVRVPDDQEDSVWQRLMESSIPNAAIAGKAPFDLPSEWVWAQVGSVANNCGQKTPDRRFTYIDVGAIDNETGTISDEAAILEAREAPSRARKLVERGAVIYSTVRPYLKNIAVVDREFDPEPIVSTAFAVMLPEPFLETRFLFYWLRSSRFEHEVATRMKGVAYPAINDKEFRTCPIPLPPLAEQKRIVAKVDALMAQCDRMEAQLRERDTRQADLARAALARFSEAPTPANLSYLFHDSFTLTPADLRKTILTLAVQGRLVPNDPSDNPLWDKLQISNQDAPFSLPSNWRWALLSDIGKCQTGRTPPTRDPANYGGGFPFIGPGQIQPNGRFLPPEKTITAFGLNNATTARPGDILMVCIGGSIGKAAICGETMGFNQQINSIHLETCESRFVFAVLTSGYFQRMVFDRATGSATPIINKGKWASIPVPIPPLAEQRRIVAKVDQLMALVDALEAQLAASRATAANLLSALVTELTNQRNRN